MYKSFTYELTTSLSMKSIKDRFFHLIDTEGNNGQYQVNSGLKSLAVENGVTNEALYRLLALWAKNTMGLEDRLKLLPQLNQTPSLISPMTQQSVKG